MVQLYGLMMSTDVKLSINSSDWKFFIGKVPNYLKYEHIKKLPKVPCIVKFNNPIYRFGSEGVLQSYDIASNIWKIYVPKSDVYVNLKQYEFTILEYDRALPTKVLLNIDNIRKLLGVECTAYGKAIKKIGHSSYLIEIDGFSNPVKLKYLTHFSWIDGVWLGKKLRFIPVFSNETKY